MTTVSVIIPTYNCRLLKRAIESVFEQTYLSFEVIVVDDGSDRADNQRIVAQLKRQYPRKSLQYWRISHSGLPAVARNVGIKKARGKLLAFLDDDDYWIKDKLKKQVKYLRLHPQVAMVCSQAYVTGTTKTYHNLSRSCHLNLEQLIITNYVINSSVLLKRKVAETLGGFDEDPRLKAYEDYEFWLRILLGKQPIFYLSRPLLHYTLNPHGLSHRYRFQDEKKRKYVFEKVLPRQSQGTVLTKKRLRILHTVEFYHPSVGGAQEVVKQLSERLAQRGHQVTIATSFLPQRKKRTLNGVKIKEFKISGNQVRGFTGIINAYQKFAMKSNFDVVMTYAAQQWTVDALLPVLPNIKAKKVLVPCGFSGLYDKNYKDYFERIPYYLRQYDWLVFLSENYRDINFAKKHGLKHYSLIPNGAGKDEFLTVTLGRFRKKYHLENQFIILTVGSHTGAKGHQESIEAFAEANLKNAVLVIIGNRLWQGGCTQNCRDLVRRLNRWSWWRKNRVLLLDLSRRETVQAFIDSDLFVFASNIECSPLVLFEAMASKTAFLTTPAGNAKEIIQWSKGGLLIKSTKTENGLVQANIDDFSEKLKLLYQNQTLSSKLAESGFNTWLKRFTWEKIVDHYEQLYYRLVS